LKEEKRRDRHCLVGTKRKGTKERKKRKDAREKDTQGFAKG